MKKQAPAPDHPLRRAAISRWRTIFVAYALILTTATHWPALDIGTEEVPAADKALHLFAFAVWMGLLRQTRWIRPIILLLALGLIWVVVDELTQALPMLERQFSALDVISSALGILVAGAWIAALRPRGGAANRARLAVQHHVTDALFGGVMKGRTLAAWLLLGAGLAQVGLGLLFALPRVLVSLPDMTAPLLYGSIQALCIGIFILLFDRLWQREHREAIASRTCPHCGIPEASARFDEDDIGTCRRCGAALPRGLWLGPLRPDAARLRRFLQWPAAAGICILGAGAGIFLGGIALFRTALDSPQSAMAALKMARGLHDLPDDFVLAVDLSVLLVALAVMVWMYRGNLARWHDRQGLECRRCGYDLHATRVTQGVGTCPECGTPFANF